MNSNTCETCRHFHREEKRWTTREWYSWTTGKYFKKHHGQLVPASHYELVEECRRFPHYEPRNKTHTCGEYKRIAKTEKYSLTYCTEGREE